MLAVVTLVCVLATPQERHVRVEPFPGVVGDEVTVRAQRDGRPLAGLEVAVELPDGSRQPCGATAADGVLHFRPEQPGYHVFHSTLDGTHFVTPLAVVNAPQRWPLALATVPLGLALLWWNFRRARGRRGS